MNKMMIALWLAVATWLPVCVASAQSGEPWTAVATTGAVDESDLSIVSMSSSTVSFAASSPAAENIVVRYNVTATAGIGGQSDNFSLRFRDNGAQARVIAVLRQVNMNTGAATVLSTIDSDSYPPSASFRTVDGGFGSCGFEYDFYENAYFIEVTLSRTSAAGLPALQLLQLYGALC
ncbi:MAG: hypothetical protein ABW352_12340 [Polyangiales bacterium]